MGLEDFHFDDFICYLNDDDTKVIAYVDIIDTNPSIIKFVTKEGNFITLPWNRILKIKQKGGKDE